MLGARATCVLLRDAVRRASLPLVSRGGFGQGDHSGELRRGRRECFDEQVIDVREVGVVHLGVLSETVWRS